MKQYDVIAELVDYRDGSRHEPPGPFTPEDETHAERLIKAGCLSKEPSKTQPAPKTPVREARDSKPAA